MSSTTPEIETPRVRASLWSPGSLVAMALLACVCVMLTLVPLRSSHDEWWHLKSGKWIDEHGLPENDIFTYTAEDIAWHNHEWLAQVGMWRIYKLGELNGLGGVRAIVVAKAAFITFFYVMFAIALGRSTGAPSLSALAVALAAALARRTLYPRPPFITYGLLIALLVILIAWRERKLPAPWLLVLGPFFALWANLHGGWMAGLVVVGAFWGEAVVDLGLARWRLEDERPARRRLLWISGAMAVSIAGTLATPYHVHLYALAARVMSDPLLDGIIFELQPANWRFVWTVDAAVALLIFCALRPVSLRSILRCVAAAGLYWTVFQFGIWMRADATTLTDAGFAAETWLREIIVVVLIVVCTARSKKGVGLAVTMLAVFFAHQAIQHQRHLPLFGIFLAPIVAHSLADWIHASAGGWTWLIRIRDARQTIPEPDKAGEVVGAIRQRRLKLGETLARAALWGTIIFYAALPEEAITLAILAKSPPAEDGEAPGLPRSLFARNLAFVRNEGARTGENGTAFNEPGTEIGAYPKLAVDRLIRDRLPGRLFNGGNYAGYLMWRLAPEKYKVFTDNRYDIYGGQFIFEERIVLEGFEGAEADDDSDVIPGWREVLDRWGVNTLFIPTDSGLAEKLQDLRNAGGPQEWRPHFSDGRFIIWVREGSPAEE